MDEKQRSRFSHRYTNHPAKIRLKYVYEVVLKVTGKYGTDSERNLTLWDAALHGRKKPIQQAWGCLSGKEFCGKGPRILQNDKLNRSPKCTLEAMKAITILRCIRVQRACQRKWSFPLPSWDTSGVSCLVMGTQVRHRHAGVSPVEDTKLDRGMKYRAYKKRLRQFFVLFCFSTWNTETKVKTLLLPTITWSEDTKKTETDFLQVHSSRKRGYGHKLEHEKYVSFIF